MLMHARIIWVSFSLYYVAYRMIRCVCVCCGLGHAVARIRVRHGGRLNATAASPRRDAPRGRDADAQAAAGVDCAGAARPIRSTRDIRETRPRRTRRRTGTARPCALALRLVVPRRPAGERSVLWRVGGLSTLLSRSLAQLLRRQSSEHCATDD